MYTKKKNPWKLSVFKDFLWVQGRDLNPRPPGYEPDELPNCSTLRYLIGAGDRNRTGTGENSHGILSPGRLPVPPLRQLPCHTQLYNNSTYLLYCQEIFKNKFMFIGAALISAPINSIFTKMLFIP